MIEPIENIIERIRHCLTSHLAVEDAFVTSDKAHSGTCRLTAYVVPNPDTAPVLRRAFEAEADGTLRALSLHEPGPDLLVAQKNRTETDFLYREIFIDNAYFREGITLPENASVIDAGANIGMFSLCAARRCPTARIFAVEPIGELCHAVQVNAQIHGADITVVNCALGDSSGVTEFTYYPGNTLMSGRFADACDDRQALQAYLSEGDSNEQLLGRLVAERMSPVKMTCAVTTLDQIVSRFGLNSIDLLKIDVEKSELEALAGMNDHTWPMVSQIVMEVHDIDGRVDRIIELLQQRGFQATSHCDARLARANCYTVFARRPDNTTKVRATDDGWRGPSPLTRQQLLNGLRQHLESQHLPIPDLFAVVARLPSSTSTTYSDNPKMYITTTDGTHHATTPTEETLIRIWQDLFHTSAIDVDMDFFDMGGRSLSVIRFIAAVQESFGENVLDPETVFETSRLKQLAEHIDAALGRRWQTASLASAPDCAAGEST